MLYETDTGKTIVCSNATGPVFKVFDSASSPYDLDATNTTTVRPLFHFDAAMWNGIDATGNPSDSTTLDENYQWTDRAHGKTTVGQTTAADQPVYMTGGENSQPYLDCDTGDLLFLSEPQGIHGNYSTISTALDGTFTLFGVAKGSALQKISFVGGAISSTLLGNKNPYFSHSSTADYLFFGHANPVNGVHPTIGHDGSTSYAVTRSWIIPRDSSNNTSIYVDGDNTASAGGGGWGPSTTSELLVFVQLLDGATYAMIGEFYEVAVWDSDLSTADRNALGAYVVAKYAIGFDDF